MMGLVVIAFFAVYIAISGLAILLAALWAKRHNRRPWLWGGLAAFVMYNFVFWDWIPTMVMQKYYCATEAGFWVYKTPEQWAKENPGVLETLAAYNDGRSQAHGFNRIKYQLNHRFSWQHEVSPGFLHIGKFENLLIDDDKREVLAKEVYFSSGRCSGAPKKLSDFKFWITQCKCSDEPFFSTDGLTFSRYINVVRGNLQRGEMK